MNDNFFMSQEIRLQVQETILKLENAINCQTELDRLWCEVKCLLLNELGSLPDLPTSNFKKQNSQFKKSRKLGLSLKGCL